MRVFYLLLELLVLCAELSIFRFQRLYTACELVQIHGPAAKYSIS